METNASLLAELKEGSSKARQRFWMQSWDDVYAISLNILKNSPDATEVAVDVLSDFLFQYIEKIEHPKAIHAYLRLVTARRAIKYAEKRQAMRPIETMEMADPLAPSPEEHTHYARLVPKLNDCMTHLTPKAQRALWLRFHHQITNDKIGALVGGSKQYIGRLITRSIALLKDCLNGLPIRKGRPMKEVSAHEFLR